MMLEIFQDERQFGFGYCDDPQLAINETKKIHRAIAVIRQQVSPAFAEINTFIHAIYLTSETQDGSCFLRSASNFYLWGAMFVYTHKEHTIPYYVGILAHECGHTALNIINSFDELVVNNPQELYAAPLREDNRPMIGIFHAFFVLSRICYVFNAIVQNNSSPYVEECRERFAVVFKKLQDTHNTIKQHAVLTDIGRRIYIGICELWNFD
ncbi:HEXXH motif-containing putative peptide modification protein [Acerihabitans sp. TG2]|uniref:aKG-HExxH-type peptide beta-hydroxylase n=1 Tax=Acerihabitans sp. TG2 TaxID=3096008 RepID=UPI002B22C79E|nr:HEXXH motif-containing putative peptide modification protein [Acerihabitans sp. TG2]MEA9389079.1 HEXXH motif-containing putative peptide modification protein [Acerihabitans sp. TG2]